MMKGERKPNILIWILAVLLSITLLGIFGVIIITRLNKPQQPDAPLILTLPPEGTDEVVDCVPTDLHTEMSQPQGFSDQMTYEVINEYPHDPQAFTQGLIFLDGVFFESTGLYGESSLRKVDVQTGQVLQQIDLPSQYFGEGLTAWEGVLIQLTWQENTGFVYQLEKFSLLKEFSYPTQGWGLTHDGERLIMSDGSDTLFFLDGETFEVVDQVVVTDQGQEISRINELEYVQGEIFANIWLTDTIIRIDPFNGEVLGRIDLSGILPDVERTSETDVLNGIAYDPETDRLFITGKFWPKVYEINLIPVE